MRILVTGASGFIGTALSLELLLRGHTVRTAVRKVPIDTPSGLQPVVVPDIAGEFDRHALLEGIEVVAHLAAIAHRAAGDEAEIRRVNVDGAARLADAAAGSARRFVFLSSVKVHGEESGERAFTETDPPRPEDVYGRSKAEAEEALMRIAQRSGMSVVTLRSPLVYGPGVKANFLRLLKWVDSGWPLPFASVQNRRSLIYVGNLVDATIRCVEHPDARGPFLVADEESVSTGELISRMARALDRPAKLVAVPTALLRLAGRAAGRGDDVRRLTGNLAVDASRARDLLDWRPPFTLDQGLAETARWFKSMQR